eukprot:tig00000317_g24014.t1
MATQEEEDAQIAARIEFLSAGLQACAPVVPALAAHLGAQLRGFVAESQVEPSESTKLRFCTGCSALLVPGLNCKMRTHRASRTKRRRRKICTEVVIRCSRCDLAHHQPGAPVNQMRTLLSQAQAKRQLRRAVAEEDDSTAAASPRPSLASACTPRTPGDASRTPGPHPPRASEASIRSSPPASPPPEPPRSSAGGASSTPTHSQPSVGGRASPPGSAPPAAASSRQAERKKAAKEAKRASLQGAGLGSSYPSPGLGLGLYPGSPAGAPLTLSDFLQSLGPASPAGAAAPAPSPSPSPPGARGGARGGRR